MTRSRGPAGRGRWRSVVGVLLTLLALSFVWFALTAPDRAVDLSPRRFLRLPLEALVLVALMLAVGPRARRVLALATGLLLALLVLLRLLDMAFFVTLDRPFDTVVDWRYLGPLTGLVVDSVGRAAGLGVIGAVSVLVLVLLVVGPWAVLRLTRVLVSHPGASRRGVLGLGALWVVLALVGVSTASSVPVASASASTFAWRQVLRVPREIHDERAFATAAAHDPLADVPADGLLTALRGKDVLFVFVESYGRVAVQGSSFAPGVDRVLRTGTRQLRADGFASRSAFLTSPTYGGISWLAHSTLQSGLWVDSQQRYSVLLRSRRSTLSKAFHRAGWRTVSDVPANTHDWPQGRFYGYDTFYDSRNVGYAGPRFGYPTMPDQYTLDAFGRRELTRRSRPPVMAEIDLLSSHAPWSRTPHLVAPDAVGDGSVFDDMPQQAQSKAVVWRSPQRVRRAYGASIEYSMRSLVSFVRRYGDRDTVVVALGDHQPASIVSGQRAGHDVPVSVIARDPEVLRRISGWQWQPGLLPRAGAPVWRMDSFRDRFLSAFGGSH
jgi:hypothetical protein